uniref:DUF547 domain-containing protein n=1 Tax=Desertifilum tharense IPPAS B-1220 TaxID=1781255 RepID=A0ACD5GXM7_9CYAN
MLDFTPWDALLQRYVNDVGSVNYSAWQEESLEQLKSWLFKVESFDLPTSCPSEVQLAYWINLYNAGVIFQVLKRYPIPSIFPRFFNIPNGLSFWRFFSRRILSQGRYSLNQIEHQILRQQFQEPRIHFALVCAARGCPLLRNQAYYPDTVFEQLEADAAAVYSESPKGSLRFGNAYALLQQDFEVVWQGFSSGFSFSCRVYPRLSPDGNGKRGRTSACLSRL